MVAGINGASNSPKNKKKTTDYDTKTGKLAWMPAPPKKEGLKQTLNNKRKYQNYRIGGGEKTFEEWKKTQ